MADLSALAERLDKMLAAHADSMPKEAYFEVDAVMRALKQAPPAAVPAVMLPHGWHIVPRHLPDEVLIDTGCIDGYDGQRGDTEHRAWWESAIDSLAVRVPIPIPAYTQAPPAAVLAGYAPVPVEPTREIVESGYSAFFLACAKASESPMADAYRAMLAAAREGE